MDNIMKIARAMAADMRPKLASCLLNDMPLVAEGEIEYLENETYHNSSKVALLGKPINEFGSPSTISRCTSLVDSVSAIYEPLAYDARGEARSGSAATVEGTQLHQVLQEEKKIWDFAETSRASNNDLKAMNGKTRKIITRGKLAFDEVLNNEDKVFETSLFFKFQQNDDKFLHLKCRPDTLIKKPTPKLLHFLGIENGGPVLVSIKSTRDTIEKYKRNFCYSSYLISEAMYQVLTSVSLGKNVNVVQFVVSKNQGTLGHSEFLRITQETLDSGIKQLNDCLLNYLKAKEVGSFDTLCREHVRCTEL